MLHSISVINSGLKHVLACSFASPFLPDLLIVHEHATSIISGKVFSKPSLSPFLNSSHLLPRACSCCSSSTSPFRLFSLHSRIFTFHSTSIPLSSTTPLHFLLLLPVLFHPATPNIVLLSSLISCLSSSIPHF